MEQRKMDGGKGGVCFYLEIAPPVSLGRSKNGERDPGKTTRTTNKGGKVEVRKVPVCKVRKPAQKNPRPTRGACKKLPKRVRRIKGGA